MIRCLVVVALFFTIAHCANGQCPSNKWQWDISVSYGMLANSLYDKTYPYSDHQTADQKPYCTFLTTRYFLYNRLALGVAVGLSSEQGNLIDPNTAAKAFSYNVNTQTAAVELYYVYYFRKYLEVYTFAGAGPEFSSTATKATTLNGETTNLKNDKFKAQYTPLGLRLGGRLGVYAEVGYGYKGLVNTGVSFKLGPGSWWKNDFR